MFRSAFLAALLASAVSSPLLANCNAYLYADDYNGSLDSINAVNSFCAKRASWWGIKDEPKNYCYTRKESRKDEYGRQFFVWSTSFFYKLASFEEGDADDVHQDIHNYLSARVFHGWPASVKIIYEPTCS